MGARIVRFVPDFYGSLDDGLNGADETDRCVVSWEVATDERAVPMPEPSKPFECCSYDPAS